MGAVHESAVCISKEDFSVLNETLGPTGAQVTIPASCTAPPPSLGVTVQPCSACRVVAAALPLLLLQGWRAWTITQSLWL